MEQVEQFQFLVVGQYHIQSKKWWEGLGVPVAVKVKVRAAVTGAYKAAVEGLDIGMKVRLKVHLKIATHKSRTRINVRWLTTQWKARIMGSGWWHSSRGSVRNVINIVVKPQQSDGSYKHPNGGGMSICAMRSRPNASSRTEVVAEEIEGAAVTDEVGSTTGMIAGGQVTVFKGLEVFLGWRKGNVRNSKLTN